MTERLVCATHDAEWHDSAAIPYGHGRHYRVHRSFPGSNDVRMTFIKPKAASTILKNYPGARAYDSASEGMDRRVYERDGVSLAIDNRDVDGIAVWQGDIGKPDIGQSRLIAVESARA